MSGVAAAPSTRGTEGVAISGNDRTDEANTGARIASSEPTESVASLTQWLRGDRSGRATEVTVAVEAPEQDADIDPARLATIGILLGGVMDPMSALMGLQSMVRDSQEGLRSEGIASAQGRAETEDAERTKQLEAARKQLEKIKSMPSWLKNIIGVVLAVVGTVASVFTGGASMALAVIGAVLLVGAEVVQALGDAGVIDPQVATAVAAGMKLVGAIVMTVAGGVGGGELASSVQGVVDVVKNVADVVSAAITTAEAGCEIEGAVRRNIAEHRTLDAAEHQVNVDEALENADEHIEQLKRMLQMFKRVQERVHEASRAQGEGMLIAARAIA